MLVARPQLVHSVALVRTDGGFSSGSLQEYTMRNLRSVILVNGGSIRFFDFCYFFDRLSKVEVETYIKNSGSFRLEDERVTLRVHGGWVSNGEVVAVRHTLKSTVKCFFVLYHIFFTI